MIFYIADTHFGDERIMKLCHRPFGSVTEMNKKIMQNWNKTVTEDDTVYVLGDFALNDAEAKIIKYLRGKKFLLVGNHDRVLTNKTLKYFEITDKIMTIKDNGRSVCLCHYPLLSYENSVYGGYHIFGHLHNNKKDIAYDIMKKLPLCFNCGVDENDFMPKTLNDLILQAKE